MKNITTGQGTWNNSNVSLGSAISHCIRHGRLHGLVFCCYSHRHRHRMCPTQCATQGHLAFQVGDRILSFALLQHMQLEEDVNLLEID